METFTTIFEIIILVACGAGIALVLWQLFIGLSSYLKRHDSKIDNIKWKENNIRIIPGLILSTTALWMFSSRAVPQYGLFTALALFILSVVMVIIRGVQLQKKIPDEPLYTSESKKHFIVAIYWVSFLVLIVAWGVLGWFGSELDTY